MSESLRIYQAIAAIGRDWNSFVRTNLGLSDIDIEECEMNHHHNLKEQRFQMIKMWQRRGGYRNNMDLLESHVRNWRGISNQTHNSQQQQQPSQISYEAVQSNTCSASQYIPDGGQKTLQTARPQIIQPRARAYAQNLGDNVKNMAATPTGDCDRNGNTLQNTPPKDIVVDSPHSALFKRREDKLRKSLAEGADRRPITLELSNQSNGSGSRKTFESESTASEISDTNSEASSSRSGSFRDQGSGDLVDGKKKKKGIKQLARKVKNLFSEKDTSLTYRFGPNLNPIPQTPGGFSENFCDGVDDFQITISTPEHNDRIMKSRSNYKVQNPKGLCLLFNNSFSTDKRRPRHGSKRDVKNMKRLWQGFGCDIFKGGALCDKSAADMKKLLKEATNPTKRYSFIVIIIMTHGGVEGGNVVFEGADGKVVKVKDILDMYNNQNAQALQNIPKFFIFQFCRGGKLDYGVQADSITGPNQETCPIDRVEIDSYEALLPTTSDQLVAYPTQEEYAALRHPENGSWFINALTNVFMRCAAYEDVEHMLTRVHSAMKEKRGSMTKTEGKVPIKAMSEHKSNFTKRLYLVPGYP